MIMPSKMATRVSGIPFRTLSWAMPLMAEVVRNISKPCSPKLHHVVIAESFRGLDMAFAIQRLWNSTMWNLDVGVHACVQAQCHAQQLRPTTARELSRAGSC